MEGPDLQDQTADRKQTKQIQFRDVFQRDGTQRKLGEKVSKLQSKLFIYRLKKVKTVEEFWRRHTFTINIPEEDLSFSDSKTGHVCSPSGLDIMFTP